MLKSKCAGLDTNQYENIYLPQIGYTEDKQGDNVKNYQINYSRTYTYQYHVSAFESVKDKATFFENEKKETKHHSV